MEKSNNLKVHYPSSSIYAAIIEITTDEHFSFVFHFNFIMQFASFLRLMNVNAIESRYSSYQFLFLPCSGSNFIEQRNFHASQFASSQIFFRRSTSTLDPLVSSQMIYYGKSSLVSLITPLIQLCCL